MEPEGLGMGPTTHEWQRWLRVPVRTVPYYVHVGPGQALGECSEAGKTAGGHHPESWRQAILEKRQELSSLPSLDSILFHIC